MTPVKNVSGRCRNFTRFHATIIRERVLNSIRSFLIRVHLGVKIRIAFYGAIYRHGRALGCSSKFIQLMSPISHVSPYGCPRFAAIIKKLAPYPEIFSHRINVEKQFSGENLGRLVGRSNVFRYKTTKERKFMLHACAFIATLVRSRSRLRRFKRDVYIHAIALAIVYFKTITGIPT